MLTASIIVADLEGFDEKFFIWMEWTFMATYAIKRRLKNGKQIGKRCLIIFYTTWFENLENELKNFGKVVQTYIKENFSNQRLNFLH